MNLDLKQTYTNLDKSEIHTSLSRFGDQCLQGWDEIMQLDIPESYKDVKNIVCCAMGGSVLGGLIVKHLFKDSLTIPFDCFSDYSVPAFVDSNTLAVVVSTSGTTEETLNSYSQLRAKGCKCIGITKGGKLGEELSADKMPVYFIKDGELNPSGVPRVAVGFQLGAYFAILQRLGLIELSESEFQKIVSEIKSFESALNIETNESENIAKKMAKSVQGKIAIIITSEHISGSGKSMNNQMNESGKLFSANFELPDVNHHQLEGMQFPETNKDNIIYLLIESDKYNVRNQKRFDVLRSLLDDLKIEHVSYKATGTTKLSQALEVFQFGAYMTYYVGLLNNVDPAPNPFVDKFKELLGK